MEEIKLYSTGCPKCKVLETKLTQAGIQFELISDFDVKEMRERGFMTAPILQVGEAYMNFPMAVEYINKRIGK